MKKSLCLPARPPYVHTVKIKLTALLVCVCVLLIGAFVYLPGVVSVSTTVNGRDLPIYCVKTDKPQIALTFDAAWGNEDTAQILSILEKHNVKATIFMTGGWVESYPDDVKAILAAGHDIGNHSENHKNMSQLSTDEMKSELMEVHDRVKNLTGYEMTLFRPPYGDYSNEVIQTATSLGYYSIQWDVDILDTHGNDTGDGTRHLPYLILRLNVESNHIFPLHKCTLGKCTYEGRRLTNRLLSHYYIY